MLPLARLATASERPAWLDCFMYAVAFLLFVVVMCAILVCVEPTSGVDRRSEIELRRRNPPPYSDCDSGYET